MTPQARKDLEAQFAIGEQSAAELAAQHKPVCTVIDEALGDGTTRVRLSPEFRGRLRHGAKLYAALEQPGVEPVTYWRDVSHELPQDAQEVLFVRDGKTVHGAWIGGIFWHSNQKMAAAKWMPLPLPPSQNAAPQPAQQPDARASAIQSCINCLSLVGQHAAVRFLRHFFAKDLGGAS